MIERDPDADMIPVVRDHINMCLICAAGFGMVLLYYNGLGTVGAVTGAKCQLLKE